MITSPIIVDEMKSSYHYPALYREVLEGLKPGNKKIMVDCTVGVASHAFKLLESMPRDGFLIGIDKDSSSLEIAAENLKRFEGRFVLKKEDYNNLDKVLDELGIRGVDSFLFDLGISSYQLNRPDRGFAILKDGPLDMRMNRDSFLSAYDLVNNLSERELCNIFKKFGEERYSHRIARRLVEERKKEPVGTTSRLVQIVLASVPAKSKYGRIHPATRIFQALRIVVNRELESLETGIMKAVSFLRREGRMGVISFHSLEDRIVKHTFKSFASEGVVKIVTKKPVI
ncbi:MAG: 16S rRNA (cytosine(1402)-N(4))-methyltransferase RsmH, partial [Candidatus Omnitrophica bacterium]|nr:16S rRNA (cytosine(1402)-N(4))-methyltransferase RsmH [Candidatus Omnitrophota bacterium]